MFNMKYKIFGFSTLLVSLAILSGCTINFGSKSTGPDGAIFKTTNQGETWQQKALIPTTSGQPNSISSLNTNVLVIDPSDQRALYYGTVDNGLFYTYDGANGWWSVSPLGKVTINAIAVDPQNKCIIYAAIDNRVIKSSDCSRTWEQIYFDNKLDLLISSIMIDHYDSRNVYIGTSRGEVIVSNDYGKSWRTLNRFDDKVVRIMIAPSDSRIIFAATERISLWRSNDKGETWVSLAENLKDFPDSNRFRDLAISKLQPGFMILANNYGLVKSINYGDDWTAIKLITPEKEAIINSVAISEQDTNKIFYTTNTTFYKTVDGGENWTTKKLPSARAGWKLLIDSQDDKVMYLGVRQLK